MKTIKSFEILEEAGISIRDFKWVNDTETYLRFISTGKSPNKYYSMYDFDDEWREKDKFLDEFEKELKQYPISCLKNIVHVEETTADAIAKMQKYAKENLIQSYKDEKHIQLKFKITHALGNFSSIHYFFAVLRDPDLSDQQRNEVWKKVINRWRKEPSDNHKSININHFRDALKARDENDRKHGSEQKCLVFAWKHRKEPFSQNELKSQFVTISPILFTPS